MKSGQIYISNPRYQHTLEPFADLFGIERVPVTGALTDKCVNQLQIAIMAKGPSISRLPPIVEYLAKRNFRRVVGQGRISYLMSIQRWYDPDLQWDTEIFRDHFFGIAIGWDLNIPEGPSQ